MQNIPLRTERCLWSLQVNGVQQFRNDVKFFDQLDKRQGKLLARIIEACLDIVRVEYSHSFGVCDCLLFAVVGHLVERLQGRREKASAYRLVVFSIYGLNDNFRDEIRGNVVPNSAATDHVCFQERLFYQAPGMACTTMIKHVPASGKGTCVPDSDIMGMARGSTSKFCDTDHFCSSLTS